jgi:integrase
VKEGSEMPARRRGKGSGSIIPRGNGFSAVYRVHQPDGKVKQVWRSGFATRAAAQQHLNEILHSIDNGTYTPPSTLTFGEYLDQWLLGLEPRVRPSTLASYRTNVRAHISPALGGTKLQALTTASLRTFYAGLRDRGLAPKTCQNVHVIIHAALSDALVDGLVRGNVAAVKRTRPPSAIDPPEMQTWDEGQLRAFLQHVHGDRLEAAWTLAATTGMRRGEILGLRWSDLDLEAATASIRQTLVTVDYTPTFSDPKTKAGGRMISLDLELVAALKAHRTDHLQERMRFGPGYADTGLVFTREDGSLIHPESFSDKFQAHAKAAGLPRIRFHDVRHSYATAWLRNGGSVEVLSKRLGHANVAITQDRYIHVSPKMDREGADSVAARIFGR